MQKLPFVFLSVFFYSAINAQGPTEAQLSEAKFQIVKATVEFLASDTAKFKKVKTQTCQTCKNFEDLKSFANENAITGAEDVIKTLVNIKLDTAAEKWNKALLTLQNGAVNKVSSGPGRERRKDLSGYAAYESLVMEISVALGKSINNKPPGNPAPVGEGEKGKTNSTTDKVLETPGTAIFFEPMFWLLCGIAAIFIYLFISALSKRKDAESGKNYYKNKVEGLEGSLQAARQNESVLKNKIAELDEQLKRALEDAKDLETRINKQHETLASKEIVQIRAADERQMPSTSNVTKPATVTIKYARYADMGDGFSNAELLDNPDSESIFEIAITSVNAATFKVINNLEIQKYALSNAQYFLGKTCQYDSFPSGKSSIITDSPGILKLQGGKWVIQNSAKISFG